MPNCDCILKPDQANLAWDYPQFIPEPGTIDLLLLGGLAILRRHRS